MRLLLPSHLVNATAAGGGRCLCCVLPGQTGLTEGIKGLLIWLKEKEEDLCWKYPRRFKRCFLDMPGLSLEPVGPSEPWRFRWLNKQVDVDLHFNFPEGWARVSTVPPAAAADRSLSTSPPTFNSLPDGGGPASLICVCLGLLFDTCSRRPCAA